MKKLVTLILSLLAIFSASAQFPKCNDMEVQQIRLNSTSDTLIITVYNDCVDCWQHVYTGLLAFNGSGDTIAINEQLDTKISPSNKDINTYYLIDLKSTNLNEITRIMMNHICDSVPVANTALGIDQDLDLSISLYPNPARTIITINKANNLLISDIQVRSIDGKKVYMAALNSQNQIAIDDLVSGMYLITFNTNRGLISKKVVVQ